MLADALALGLCIVWCIAAGWQAGTAVLASLHARKGKHVRCPTEFPPVSIVVPTSDALAIKPAVFRSLRELDYPELETVLCVSERASSSSRGYGIAIDPGMTLLHVVPREGENAKVAALAAGIRAARHDLLLLSDDNVVGTPIRIQEQLAYLSKTVRIVTTSALGSAPATFWAEVDIALMNGHFARLHLAVAVLGRSFLMGKSLLVGKETLRALGGIEVTGGTCCEDADLGERIAAAGWQVGLSHRPIVQIVGARGFKETWQRHRRWLVCRRNHAPLAFAAELLMSASVASAAAAVLVAMRAPAASPAVGALGTMALWLAIELAFIRFNGWHLSWQTPFAWLVREFGFPFLWLSALCARTVTWHDRKIPALRRRS
jgi:ceramide glucosyltransferase